MILLCSEASSHFNNNKTFHYLCKHCAKLFNYFLIHWHKVHENLNFKWGKSFKSRFECHWFNCENSSQNPAQSLLCNFCSLVSTLKFYLQIVQVDGESFVLSHQNLMSLRSFQATWFVIHRKFLLNKVFNYRYQDWSWHLWNLPSV